MARDLDFELTLYPDPVLRRRGRAGAGLRRRARASIVAGDVRAHVREQGRRPGRAPGRPASSASSCSNPTRRARGRPGAGQPDDPRALRARDVVRGGLPLVPRDLRRGRPSRALPGAGLRRRRRADRARVRRASRAASSSTSTTTSRACCWSTACRRPTSSGTRPRSRSSSSATSAAAARRRQPRAVDRLASSSPAPARARPPAARSSRSASSTACTSGHQAILAANVRARARARGAIATVVTFRRHPKRVLLGHAPRTLTSLEHRLELFRRAGIEHTRRADLRRGACATLSAGGVRRARSRSTRLGARALRARLRQQVRPRPRGTPELLRALGFDVEVVPQGARRRPRRSRAPRSARRSSSATSTAPRACSAGRSPCSGRSCAATRRGRTLGFPTANLDLHHELHPPAGRVRLPGARRLARAARARGARARRRSPTSASARRSRGERRRSAARRGAPARLRGRSLRPAPRARVRRAPARRAALRRTSRRSRAQIAPRRRGARALLAVDGRRR